ncbi:MAG: hypothetical protein MRJ96_01205 [Nitrospirales bacterium]|nr:hypothetical protein [Nitrospira sp.]MDR4500060.1 hypothetical protein [Nitrospirales bacterium]
MSTQHDIQIERGTAFAIFSYDIGTAINLDKADLRITATKTRGRLKRKRPTPQYFDYRPPPLRISQEVDSLAIDNYSTRSIVDVVLYDFGAVSVIYALPIHGSFTALLPLSEALHENAVLLHKSRERVDQLLTTIQDAVEKPNVAEFMEDYSIFHVEAAQPAVTAAEVLSNLSQNIAQILRCEREPLSDEEVQDATSCHIAFGKTDISFIDWNGAFIYGEEMEDVCAVLEFANVELLERRYLDDQLDTALDQAYESLTKFQWKHFRWPGSFHADLRGIGQLQVDSAILFERVTNALKLLGDQYLARVYRLTSRRFHLQEWDQGIHRKLETIESVYEKLADQTGNRRMEVLEWIIIILIAVSIILPFIPGFPGY